MFPCEGTLVSFVGKRSREIYNVRRPYGLTTKDVKSQHLVQNESGAKSYRYERENETSPVPGAKIGTDKKRSRR